MINPVSLINQKSTKGLIVSLLSEEWPSTTKEIYNKISRESSNGLTYQAVHKALKEFELEGVVVKREKGYALNSSWVKQMKQFGETVDRAYSLNASQKTSIDFEKPVQSYTFTNFMEMARFSLSFFVQAPNENNKPGVCRCVHSWCVTNLSNEEYAQLKKLLSETHFYEIIAHKTPLDVTFGKLMSDLGKTVKLGVNFSDGCDILVKGDFVYQVYFSEGFKHDFDTICKKTKKLEQLELNALAKNVLEKETSIKVVIVKDAEFAEGIRSKTLQYFKKSRH